MKRPSVVPILAASLAAGLLVTISVVSSQFGAMAQDATPPAATLHPIVGAWLLSVDVYDESDPPVLVIYHPDRTYTDAAAGRASGIGVWEPIDEHSVMTNVVFHSEDEAGNTGLTRIRTVTTVDESGNAYTSEYTRELIAADGTSSGQLGPGTATAERLTVEPQNEPEGPMVAAEGTPTS